MATATAAVLAPNPVFPPPTPCPPAEVEGLMIAAYGKMYEKDQSPPQVNMDSVVENRDMWAFVVGQLLTLLVMRNYCAYFTPHPKIPLPCTLGQMAKELIFYT